MDVEAHSELTQQQVCKSIGPSLVLSSQRRWMPVTATTLLLNHATVTKVVTTGSKVRITEHPCLCPLHYIRENPWVSSHNATRRNRMQTSDRSLIPDIIKRKEHIKTSPLRQYRYAGLPRA